MRGKKFLAIFMAVMMIFVMCSCAAADSGESDKKEPVSTSAEETEKETSKEETAETSAVAEETEKGTQEEIADDEENVLGLTDSQMDEIYALVAKDILEQYIEPNSISIDEFKWPDTTTDEGLQQWDYEYMYLSQLLLEYDSILDITVEQTLSGKETLRDLVRSTFDLSETDLMDIVAASLLNNYARLSDYCTMDDFLLIDWSTEIPQNVTFSDEQIALGKSLSEVDNAE